MTPTQILMSIHGCFHDISLSYGLPVSLFLAGLVGGATHCVAMCGPFVISQSEKLEKLREMALLPYHMGRLTTYVVLAVLLNSVLSIAFLFLPIRSFIVAPLLITAGLIFFVSAFPALSKVFPWIAAIRFSVPYRWISGGIRMLSQSPNALKQYMMGVLLGFMPCGLVVSALMASATAPTTAEAAVAMVGFSIGTMPALIITAFGGQLLKLKYPTAMKYISQGFMIWSGVWLFALAGMILI